MSVSLDHRHSMPSLATRAATWPCSGSLAESLCHCSGRVCSSKVRIDVSLLVVLVNAVHLLDMPQVNLLQQGVERIAGREPLQAQGPGQGGLAGQGAVDMADASDPQDEEGDQAHQLIGGGEAAIGRRFDRDLS